jgi:hypothetical protein
MEWCAENSWNLRRKFMEPAIFYCRLESPNSTHGGGDSVNNFNNLNPKNMIINHGVYDQETPYFIGFSVMSRSPWQQGGSKYCLRLHRLAPTFW